MATTIARKYKIASLRLLVENTPDLTCSDRLEPFATDEPETDYRLRFRPSESDEPEHAECGPRLDSIITDEYQYRWSIYTDSLGREGVTVSFDTHEWLQWTDALIDGREVTIAYRKKAGAALGSTYIFPLFNLIMNRLLNRNRGIAVHSSVVCDGGRGYLFTAVSGTGKSTMAKIWERAGATIVNDDAIMVDTNPETPVAHNIPMPYYTDVPKSAPLDAIFLISQSPVNVLEPVTGAAAAMQFMTNTVHHSHAADSIERHLQSINRICSRVPIFRLGFKPDADVVDLIRKTNLTEHLTQWRKSTSAN